MDKIQKISTYVVALIAIVASYLWYAIASIEDPIASDVDAFYLLTEIMLAAVVGITVVASLIGLFTDMKKLVSAVVVLVIVAIVWGVSYYMLASDDVVTFLGQQLATAEEGRMVGAGLFATYITGAIAILSIVLSPVIKLMK